MEKHDVTVFQPYPFSVGQKITIESGPRRGDWEVIGLTDKKVTLKCPISHREFDWDLFCYVVEERTGETWPHDD
jgi:hypothetical protein